TDRIGGKGRDIDSPTLDFDGGTVQDDNIDGDRFRRRSDGGLSQSAILALGKIGHPGALPVLFLIAQEGNDLALHSTVVHAMGLIDVPKARRPLTLISKRHPNELIRDQAERTLERLGTVD
ncbi:MAG: HEAT repeat domain-containing protein, partial [Nitrospirales bacterium]|nr:HEAT repeat domain-containing protein [Nitrospirales bacterium]